MDRRHEPAQRIDQAAAYAADVITEAVCTAINAGGTVDDWIKARDAVELAFAVTTVPRVRGRILEILSQLDRYVANPKKEMGRLQKNGFAAQCAEYHASKRVRASPGL